MEVEITQLRALVEMAATELPKMKAMVDELIAQKRRYRVLLEQVRDAGVIHSHNCDCEQCCAWRAIDKELSR